MTPSSSPSLQMFDDAQRGRGMLVLLERRDGLVDYY
jgi:hypothetical protein